MFSLHSYQRFFPYLTLKNGKVDLKYWVHGGYAKIGDSPPKSIKPKANFIPGKRKKEKKNISLWGTKAY